MKSQHCVQLLLVFAATVTAVAVWCPTNWVRQSGFCYLFVRQYKNWHSAEAECQTQHNSHLSSVLSSQERDYIWGNIRPNTIWIGLRKDPVKKHFYWSDGFQYNEHFWGRGEPNHLNNEYCVEQRNSWFEPSWNDAVCTKKNFFVCKASGLLCSLTVPSNHLSFVYSYSHADSSDADRTISFSCRPGYKLTGSQNITCRSNGTWSDRPPACAEITCAEIDHPNNGIIVSSGNVYLSTANFRCFENYKLSGPQSLTCTVDGTWSNTPPECSRIANCTERLCHDQSSDNVTERHKDGDSPTNSNSVVIVTVSVCLTVIVVAIAVALSRVQGIRIWPETNHFYTCSSNRAVHPVVMPVVMATAVRNGRGAQTRNESASGSLTEEQQPIPHTPPPPYSSVCFVSTA